jgi:hypothetical protein
MTGDSLSDYFSSQGVEVKIIKTAPALILKNARREMGDELLGHRSTRTTEIYTHVSRRNQMVVRSPIEDMDVS